MLVRNDIVGIIWAGAVVLERPDDWPGTASPHHPITAVFIARGSAHVVDIPRRMGRDVCDGFR